MKPLAIDLCSGLGGWTEGLLAEGWNVIGFDIERHKYGPHQYPAQLVLQDILTLDGRQFRGHASLIVASPPCQRYSYMAMPWTRAKDLITWHRDPAHPERITELNALFDACVRIGREAGCPIVIENVRGAQPWVGCSRWNYGSFHLWGDVPALMPITFKGVKVSGMNWSKFGEPGYKALGFNTTADQRTRALADDSVKCGGSAGDDWFAHHNRQEFYRRAGLTVPVECRGCGKSAVMSSNTIEADLDKFARTHSECAGSKVIVGRAEDRATKNSGGSWFNVAHNTTSGTNNNPARGESADGVKQGGDWFNDPKSMSRQSSSKSSARKAASARIAKIPLLLARHIAKVYFPRCLIGDVIDLLPTGPTPSNS